MAELTAGPPEADGEAWRRGSAASRCSAAAWAEGLRGPRAWRSARGGVSGAAAGGRSCGQRPRAGRRRGLRRPGVAAVRGQLARTRALFRLFLCEQEWALWRQSASVSVSLFLCHLLKSEFTTSECPTVSLNCSPPGLPLARRVPAFGFGCWLGQWKDTMGSRNRPPSHIAPCLLENPTYRRTAIHSVLPRAFEFRKTRL